MIAVNKCIRITAPIGDVYRFFERFENFPSFVHSVESVRGLDAERSHWVVRAPFNMKVEFDSRLTEKRENELIRWESVHGDTPGEGTLKSNGELRFKGEDGGNSTIVHMKFNYEIPGRVAGRIAEALHTLGFPDREVERGLEAIKSCIETRCAA
jgi:uncharacterized membrane protein